MHVLSARTDLAFARHPQITAHVAALDLHVRRADPSFFDDPANQNPPDNAPTSSSFASYDSRDRSGRSTRSRGASPTSTPRKSGKRSEEPKEEGSGGDEDGGRTLYCLCGRESYGEMVACDNEQVG